MGCLHVNVELSFVLESLHAASAFNVGGSMFCRVVLLEKLVGGESLITIITDFVSCTAGPPAVTIIYVKIKLFTSFQDFTTYSAG